MGGGRGMREAQASLLGKLPWAADFVRLGAAGPASAELDRWLVRAVEALHGARGTLPDSPIRYAFAAPSARALLLGVLGPSKDRLGREFPVTVFTELPEPSARRRWAGLPVAYDGFFAGALLLLEDLPALDPAAIPDRLAALPVPGAQALEDGDAHCRRLLRDDGARAFRERVFGAEDGADCYGLFTFLTAAGAQRGQPAGSVGAVLDCPVPSPLDALAWLALAERLLPEQCGAASWFWTQHGSSARLLLALGACTGDLLRALSDPGHVGPRLWPLRTTRAEAVARARAAMEPALAELEQGAGGRPQSIENLLDRLAAHDLPG